MAKSKIKTYRVLVTETYSKWYDVKAHSVDEAYTLADEIAADDDEITNPENFDERNIVEVDEP